MSLQVEFAEDEQRVSSAVVIAVVEGVELEFPPGPYAEVEEIKDDVQDTRVGSLSSVCRKDAQPGVIPEGIRGLFVWLAAAADDDCIVGVGQESSIRMSSKDSCNSRETGQMPPQ